jgi:hypothetical protein
MSLFLRVRRFCDNDVGWYLIVLPVYVGFLIYRYPSPWFTSLLVGTCLICFVGTYPFRSNVILNYRRYRRPIEWLLYVMIAAFILSRLLGHSRDCQFAVAAYFSLALGIIFWAASDPMNELIDWLSHPLEFGRLPDEIQPFVTRWIDWPDCDGPVQARLFRFRYGTDWDYGITGPLTFALGDQDFEGKSTDEIIAAYRNWYQGENIGSLLHEAEGKST